jgi:Leucine-rich repeat (LRR) protein
LLEKLDISANLIVNISKCGFCSLQKSLVVLNLSLNKLDSIKKYHFTNLSCLKELDLSKNNLLSIELGSFDDLKQLTVLDLSYNCLFKIQESLFHVLGNLKMLNLSMNLIKSVNFKSLQSQNKLTDLILSNNLIEHFDIISNWTLPKLSFIDISYNTILKTFYLNNKYTAIDLNGNNQVYITSQVEINPQLKSLNIKNLNLNTLKMINFSLIPNLSELDLGLIDLTGFASVFNTLNVNLKRLWLRGSILNSDLNFLNRFKNLAELDLNCVKGIVWHGNVTIYFGKR